MISIIFIALLIPGIVLSNNTKMDAYSNYLLKKVVAVKNLLRQKPDSFKKSNLPIHLQEENIMLEMLINISGYEKSFLGKYGVKIRAEYGNILNVFVPIERFEELLNDTRIKSIQLSKPVNKQLDKSRKDIRADEVHQGLDLPSKYDGSGVIIGIVDSGIDFTHPDFMGVNGTRILYLWDMSDDSNVDVPEGYSWGREYTKNQIDNMPEIILQRDGNGSGGHGTHVAGTAAGSGRSNINMKGIAPNADIIFVKAIRDQDSYGNFASTDILAACQYIFKKADELGKPAVINLSLGSIVGPHDGTALDELALSSMTGDGRIIVVAAGNSGIMPIHAGMEVQAGENVETLILPINLCEFFPELCPDIQNLFLTAADVWGDAEIFDSVAVGVYDFSNPLEMNYLGEFVVPKGESIENLPLMNGDDIYGFVSIDAKSTNLPNNNSFNIFITITNAGDENIQIDNYLWSLRFVIAKNGRVDLWAGLPIPQALPIQGKNGIQMKGDNLMTISNYASCKNVISVASYISKNEWTDIDGQKQTTNQNIGDRSLFSSLGPTRDGRLAPTISAPGDIIFAPMSSHLDEFEGYLRQNVLEGGNYIGMQGTSMASPHVAGAVALMLQSKPFLNFERIVMFLNSSAKKDNFTGPSANIMWGVGKLDVYAAVRETATSIDDYKDLEIEIFPNPANENLYVEYSTNADLKNITIYDIFGYEVIDNGRKIRSGKGYSVINLDNIASGVYIIKLHFNNQIITKPVTIIK